MASVNGTKKIGDSGGKHVLVWSQSELNEPVKPKGWFGTRHYVTIMLFFGMANAYTMRTNMSVAIVAMVNHTALPKDVGVITDDCGGPTNLTSNDASQSMADGEFIWNKKEQGYLLGSFFWGYVLTQVPFGILAKKYGSTLFLGWGMMFNSVMGLLVPAAASIGGLPGLIAIRFLQGLGEGPIVPCSHALLSKWIPPNERSRMGAIVYSGAQFGTVMSMPLSGILSNTYGGWPTIFYFFGTISAIWSIIFIWTVYEDPEHNPKIDPAEKKYINETVWGTRQVVVSPPTPYKAILTSWPFYAILVAHVGQNFGYETLMTELPTFMKEILHFNIKENGLLSSIPYFSMWMFSMLASCVADHFISSGKSRTLVRKIACGIGHFGPAICLIFASYTGCNPYLTVAILSVGVGLNGAAYSGFKVNHMDISPRFAGILMSFTNCSANITGLLAPLIAGYIIHERPTQEAWREVFFVSSGVYFVFCTFYLIFASAELQPWDSATEPENTNARDIDETVH